MSEIDAANVEPPPIPELPPGQTFDLSRPHLTGPDGKTFVLPPNPPFAGTPGDIIHPDAIEQVGWMVLAKRSGMLHGLLMNHPPAADKSGPTAHRPALVWKIPEQTFFTDDVENARQDVTFSYTEDSFAYVRNNFDSESASASFMFASASFERSHSEREAGAQETKQLFIHACDRYPRATVLLEECTDVNPEFESAVEAALSQGSIDEQFDALNVVFDHYGHAVAKEVTLGGIRSFDEKQRINSHTSEEDVANTYRGAFAASGLGGSASASVSFQDASGNTVSAQNIAARMTLQIHGGDVTLGNANSWAQSVKPPQNWTVIAYSGLRSTIELLRPELKEKVLRIWAAKHKAASVLGQPQAWTADDAKTVETDGFLIGTTTAVDRVMNLKEFSTLTASTGPASQTPSWRRLGMAAAHVHIWRGTGIGVKYLPVSSFCQPVRKQDGALFRFTQENPTTGYSVSFIPLGSSEQSFLGTPFDIDPAAGTFPITSDGFLICTMEKTAAGERGTVVAQKGSDVRGVASIDVQNDTSIGQASFCVPVSKSLEQIGLNVTPPQGKPRVAFRFVPLVNATFGPIEERDFDVVYTADQSDGFLIGWLDGDAHATARIRMESGETQSALTPGPGASIDCIPGLFTFVTMATAMMPVRRGMSYRTTLARNRGNWAEELEGVPNDGAIRKRLYWVPLIA